MFFLAIDFVLQLLLISTYLDQRNNLCGSIKVEETWSLLINLKGEALGAYCIIGHRLTQAPS
jgi:hypothetical protein